MAVDLRGAAYAASRISSTLKGSTKQFGWLQALTTETKVSSRGSPALLAPIVGDLGEERAPVGLEEFSKPDRAVSSDLFNQIVRSRKHPILVVLCNLCKMLPDGVGAEYLTRAVGSHSLKGPGIHLLITYRFADDLGDLDGNFGEGVLFFSVERIYLSFVLVRREKDFRRGTHQPHLRRSD